MNIVDFWTITKIVIGLVGSISISGFVVWFFVKLTANTLAEQYKKKIEFDFEKRLEGYRNQLEILKATTVKYNDRQFELYLDLWKNLQELKFSCLDLWEHVSKSNLKKFHNSLVKTERQIDTTSILLEDNHHTELLSIIDVLKEFNTGKEKLHAKYDTASEYEIEQIIGYNKIKKDKCLELIENLKGSVKRTIKGISN